MLPKDPFRAGQRLSATTMTGIVEELRRLGAWSAAAPLALTDGPTGMSISAAITTSIWIKLTEALGTDGKYAWTQQIAETGGAWTDALGYSSGTTTDDPAYETNGNDAIDLATPPVVRAWRDPTSNAMLFTVGDC